jgi:uracil-DNA glycosylase
MNEFNKLKQLPNDWDQEFKLSGIPLDLFLPIERLKELQDIQSEIYPDIDNVYNAFKLCSFKDTKVVILGQDPYHQKGVANGLAFSVNPGCKIPASLRNIYKEIESDVDAEINKNGDLNQWAEQGVLLLNCSLTVEDSKPGSHSSFGWENITDSVIKLLNKKSNIVFLLWGAHSIKKRYLIDESKNIVFTAPHPSPLSAYRGFFGCKHFTKTNLYLSKNRIKTINW